MGAVTICSDFGAQENKVCHCFHCFSICLPWSGGTKCYDLSFLNVSFKPTFLLSSFTFIKRLFSSFLLSAIMVVSAISKMVGGVKLHLESTPSLQTCSEGSNKSYVYQDLETPQRLSQNCVWVSPAAYGSAVDCCRGRASGCSRPGYGISPLGGGCH